MNNQERINLDISQGDSFEKFLKKEKIEILQSETHKELEIFRIKNQKGSAIPFFAFESTKTIECFDPYGQELFRKFLKIEIYA